MSSSVILDLILRDTRFTSPLKNAERHIRAFGASSVAVLSRVSGIFAAIGAPLSAGVALQAFAVQERASAKLEAVLKSTGYAAGFTAAQLERLAANRQRITTFGDEASIAMMAVLATFKEIQGPTYLRAVKAIQDMATVMDQDLKSAAVQVGKALNDPVKGVAALGEVGVSFTEKQKKLIKTLVETNQVAKAQAIILQELESEFGGAAEAVAGTASGKIQQMKNSLGDLAEVIGSQLAPVVTAWADDLGAAAEGAELKILKLQEAALRYMRWNTEHGIGVGKAEALATYDDALADIDKRMEKIAQGKSLGRATAGIEQAFGKNGALDAAKDAIDKVAAAAQRYQKSPQLLDPKQLAAAERILKSSGVQVSKIMTDLENAGKAEGKWRDVFNQIKGSLDAIRRMRDVQADAAANGVTATDWVVPDKATVLAAASEAMASLTRALKSQNKEIVTVTADSWKESGRAMGRAMGEGIGEILPGVVGDIVSGMQKDPKGTIGAIIGGYTGALGAVAKRGTDILPGFVNRDSESDYTRQVEEDTRTPSERLKRELEEIKERLRTDSSFTPELAKRKLDQLTRDNLDPSALRDAFRVEMRGLRTLDLDPAIRAESIASTRRQYEALGMPSFQAGYDDLTGLYKRISSSAASDPQTEAAKKTAEETAAMRLLLQESKEHLASIAGSITPALENAGRLG